MDKNLKKLQSLLAVLDTDHLTKSDFLEHFEKVIEQVVKLKAEMAEAVKRLEQTYAKLNKKLGDDHTGSLTDLKGQVDNVFVGKQLKRMQDEHGGRTATIDELVNLVKERVATIKDGRAGKDADENRIIDKVISRIPDHTDTLNELKETFKRSEQELVEKISSARRKTTPFGGSVVHKFADDITPTGTVNGTNKVFTLSASPIGLQVFVNGAKMTVTEDYTLSNKTITFLTAPPSTSIIRCYYRYF